MEDEETQEQEAPPEQGGKLKLVIFAAIGIVAFIGGGLAMPKVMSLIQGGETEESATDAADADENGEAAIEVGGPAVYYPILPPLTSNFSDELGRRRFLQVSFEVVARKQSVIDDVKTHDAVIRNALLMTLSDVDYETAITREGKEQVRERALDAIRTVLQQHTGDPGVENVYLTSFIVQ